MLDLKFDQLQLNLDNVAGHEHRIEPIVARAAAIFAERLEARWGNGGGPPASRMLDRLSAQPLSLNLNRMSNEQAAQEIATAWFEAVTQTPKA